MSTLFAGWMTLVTHSLRAAMTVSLRYTRALHLISTHPDNPSVQLWDRRTLGAATGQPVGALVGHCDGLTHVSSRKDGRYVISNSKDQTIKLWDLRKPYRADGPIPPPPTRQQWDYRRWSAHATAEYRM